MNRGDTCAGSGGDYDSLCRNSFPIRLNQSRLDDLSLLIEDIFHPMAFHTLQYAFIPFLSLSFE